MKLSITLAVTAAALCLPMTLASGKEAGRDSNRPEKSLNSNSQGALTPKSIPQSDPYSKPKKRKSPIFSKVMKLVEKVNKKYFHSGNFDPDCPESYDFLFYSDAFEEEEDEEKSKVAGKHKDKSSDKNKASDKQKDKSNGKSKEKEKDEFKFHHKSAALIIAYMIEAEEDLLAIALVSKWIHSRQWKQHNRERIYEDLEWLIKDLKDEPEMLIWTFKLFVEEAAMEIVHESSWASLVASIILIESEIDSLEEKARRRTVAFLIDHFFRVSNEDQDALSEQVMKKLTTSLKDEVEDEIIKWYLKYFETRLANLKLLGKSKSNQQPSNATVSPLKEPSLPIKTEKPKATSSTASKSAPVSSNASSAIDSSVKSKKNQTVIAKDEAKPADNNAQVRAEQKWYQNGWLWISVVSVCVALGSLAALYFYSSKNGVSSI